MLKDLSVREKIVKIILIALVIFSCITIFPKNFKIAVLNYDGRQSAVVLGDAEKGDKRETSYSFGKGNFYVTPITKGKVKSLYIEDEKEYVDEVTAYYGSVKISEEVLVSGEDGALVADISYSNSKIVIMIALYAILCLALMACGIVKVFKSSISLPKKLEINIDWIDVAIFGGISMAYMIVSYIVSQHQLIKWIYPLEIAFSGFMLFVTLCVEKQLSNHRIGTSISALPIGTCLAISINKICAFTFVDGHQAIMEQVNYDTDKLRHWEKNSARLNYIIMGTFERFNFIERLKGETPAKIMHWFFGVVLFVYIVWFITKKLLRNDSNRLKVFQFTAVFCSIFLYNYTLTALKNYNYDLFSITFGAIAFIHMIYAARTCSKNYAISALVFATLGTLEKIIVWPIMLLCMLAYVIIATLDEEKPLLKGVVYTLKAEVIAILTSACCNLWIQYIVRGDYFPNYKITNVIRPLQGQMHSVVSRVFTGLDLNAEIAYVLGNIVQLFVIWIGFIIIKWIYGERDNYKINVRLFYRTVLIINSIIMIYILVKGVVDGVLYTQITGAIETSISTLGSALLPIIIGLSVFYRQSVEHKELLVFLVVFGSIVPILYIIIGEINKGRYFNLFNVLIVIVVDIILLDAISDDGVLKAIVGALLWGILTFFEISSFGPDYYYYRPFWNMRIKNHVEYYAGGVERLKIGEALEKKWTKKVLSGEKVSLIFNYGGEWNACPVNWECETFLSEGLYSLGNNTIDDIKMGDEVYYVFTMADRYSFYPMPNDEYVPVLSLKVRGVLVGNVYRSEDLKSYFEEVFCANN